MTARVWRCRDRSFELGARTLVMGVVNVTPDSFSDGGRFGDAQAAIVNDVTAGRDPAMFPLVRESGAGMALMHMLGEPKTMQDDPRYEDVVGEIHEYLRERVEAAVFAGVATDRLAVDPGIGFGKS